MKCIFKKITIITTLLNVKDFYYYEVNAGDLKFSIVPQLVLEPKYSMVTRVAQSNIQFISSDARARLNQRLRAYRNNKNEEKKKIQQSVKAEIKHRFAFCV